jgi:hypothetical protein
MKAMPRISYFFGIVIRMYYDEHSPPHFHAEYGDNEAVYEIATLEIMRGKIPRRCHAMVVEWATLHRPELLANWERVLQQVPLVEIEPLD